MSIYETLLPHKDYIVTEYNKGRSTRDIAKQFNCNQYFTHKIILDFGQLREKTNKGRSLKDYKDQIIEMHNNNYSAYKISKELGFASVSVLKYMKKIGLDTSSKSTNKSETKLRDKKDLVIKLRCEGKSANEIGKIVGHAGANVWKLLNKEGINTSRECYNVDLNYFDKIDTEDKAYILGYWYADGNVMRDRIRIQLADLEMIDLFKEKLQYEGPLYIHEPRIEGRKLQHELSIARRELVDALIKLGCPPKKSLILTLPNENQVPKHLMKHFIRGWHDGDGNIYYNKNQNRWKIQMIGTEEFLQGVVDHVGVTGYWSKRRNDETNNYNYALVKHSEIIKFLEYIYDGATICLDRKRLKAIECLADLKQRTTA